MEEVKAWLSSVGLGEYCTNFEDNGWDEMTVLPEMTDSDIETCIRKAGHRAKFKKALRLMTQQPTPEMLKRDNSFKAPGKGDKALLEGISDTIERCCTDTSDQHPLPLSTLAGQHTDETTTTIPYCAVKQSSSHEVPASSAINSQWYERDKSTSPIDVCKSACAVSDEENRLSCFRYNSLDSSFSGFEMTENAIIKPHDAEAKQDAEILYHRQDHSEPFSMIKGLAQGTSHQTSLNLTIIEHSDHTTVAGAPAQQMMSSPSSPVDTLKDQMRMIADSFVKKDHLYVETKAFQELQNVVEETNWATVLGKPGDGKSATAAHLMLIYRNKGYEPLFISSPQEWKTVVSCNDVAKQFIVIDDIFGTSYLNNKKVNEWLAEIENMEKIVKEKEGDIVVVCTSRKSIFADVDSSLARYACFRKLNIVDMTERGNQLSGDEKLAIFNKFADKHAINISEKSLAKIPFIDTPHGFPHCVELFCTNAFSRQNGISFFENPTKCLQKEIRNLQDKDPFKFFVLLLMLKTYRLNTSYIAQMINKPSDDEIKLFRATGITIESAYPRVVKAIDALKDTYIVQEKIGTYTFSHESLKENVAAVYISVNPVHAAELFTLQEIISYSGDKCDNNQTDISKPTSLPLPLDILVNKVTKELLSHNINTACKCSAWKDQLFVNEWLRYIVCELSKLQTTFMTFMLKQIFCSVNKRNREYGRNFLPDQIFFSAYICKYGKYFLGNLIYHHLKTAVVSLLENKFLQEKLNEIPAWKESLQEALEIACTENGKFDLDMISRIVSPKGIDRKFNLDGSNCLANALRHSKVQVAMFLLKETLVNHNVYKGSARYFNCLASSSIMSSDFNEISCMLLENGSDIASTDPFQWNTVLFAVKELTSDRCLHIFPQLLKLGANFNHCVTSTGNAINILCSKTRDSRCFELLDYLINIGVDASQSTIDGAVPLMLALKNDLGIDCIERLMEFRIPNRTDKFGRGYFHYLFLSKATPDRFTSYCNMLLGCGEDINATDKDGKSPIFIFCEKALENARETDDITKILEFLDNVGVQFCTSDRQGRNLLHCLFAEHANPELRYEYAQSPHCDRFAFDYSYISFNVPRTPKSNCASHQQYWRILPKMDESITSSYLFLTKQCDIDCFQADVNGINPVMLAVQNRAEFTLIKHLLSRPIHLKYDKKKDGYFQYLARSHASDETFDFIKSVLIKNNIPNDPTLLWVRSH